MKQETDEVSFKELMLKLSDWYKYIASKWLKILIFSILGALGGYGYSLLSKPVYNAITTFVLEESDRGGGLGQYSGIASMVGLDVGGGGGGTIFQGENIIELYKSRRMIQKTLLTEIDFNGKKQLLVDRYVDFKELRKIWNENDSLKKITFNTPTLSRSQDSILGTIVYDINKNFMSVVKPDKKLNIIRAEVKSTDEFFAKAFNEQIVKNVNDFYIQTKSKKSLDNIAIIQQKTDSVRKVMDGSIYAAAAVTDATPNLNITRQVQRLVPIQRSQFSVETNKAMLAELLKNLELSKIAMRKEAPLIQVVDQPTMPLDKQRTGPFKGIIMGGLIFWFLSVLFFLVKKIFIEIMN